MPYERQRQGDDQKIAEDIECTSGDECGLVIDAGAAGHGYIPELASRSTAEDDGKETANAI